MANSRKSRRPNSSSDGRDLSSVFERALRDILAGVCISTPEKPISMAVAYSGGLDSSVLLHLAAQYAAARSLSLFAFHIHHGLSPNADAWLAHCETEATRSKVAFFARSIDVNEADKRGVEEAARIGRYAALGDLCRNHGVSLLVTAHHQDDQAETVLLQLMRGAGLPGLSGMAALQQPHDLLGPDVALGRPLLGVSRATLEQGARQFEVRNIDDESNRVSRYKRNALRHQVTPVMETHFPGFAPLVARAAAHMQSAQSLLHELAMIDLAACKSDDECEALSVPELKKLSPQRADNLLRTWLYLQGVRLPSTSRLHEIREQMIHAVSDMHPFFNFGSVQLHRIRQRLELHASLGAPPSEPLMLRWQGQSEIAVPQWNGKLIFEPKVGLGLSIDRLRSGTLVLRCRSGQERLKVAANRPSKSLKSLFQESSVAPWRRSWMPLVYLDADLVFVAGLGMDARQTTGDGLALRWESS